MHMLSPHSTSAEPNNEKQQHQVNFVGEGQCEAVTFLITSSAAVLLGA